MERPIALVALSVELGTFDDQGRLETSLVLTLGEAAAVPVAPTLKPKSIEALCALVDLQVATFAEWRDAIGCAKTTFHHARTELVTCGYVEHLVDGSYRATTAGKERSTGFSQGPLGPGGSGADPDPIIRSKDDTAEIEGPRVQGSKQGPKELLDPRQGGGSGEGPHA